MMATGGGTLSLGLGLALGAVGSVPLAGPISVLVLRRGVAGRTSEGRAAAAGAAVAEGIHAYLAFRGLSWIVVRWPQALIVSEIFGVAVLILAGVWLWLRPMPRSVGAVSDPDPLPPGLGRLPWGGRQGNPTHLALGFLLTGANLSILLNWTAVLGVLSRFGYHPGGGADGLLFAVGVAIGIAVWFELALRLLARYRLRLAEGILRWSTRAVAALLVSLGGLGAFALVR